MSYRYRNKHFLMPWDTKQKTFMEQKKKKVQKKDSLKNKTDISGKSGRCL